MDVGAGSACVGHRSFSERTGSYISHVAVVECLISDLDAFQAEVEALGGQLVRDAKQYRAYYGQQACAHKVTVNGAPHTAFEVGVVPTGAEGTFTLAYDAYDGICDRAFGSNLVNLRNGYLAHVAENQLRRKGYRVQRVEEGEQIRVSAVR